tara:strand:- start:120 stop:737 length:618 start_codon:yes stop_codon:yes gene_type:complete
MSFRIEKKLFVIPEKKLTFLEWLSNSGGIKIFSDREVSSIYFDNENFQMFKESEEGIVPRKKIRIRSYNLFKEPEDTELLETKISSSEGRFKQSNSIKNYADFIKFGIFDKQYGACSPKLRVNYKRSYYKVKNLRLTYDRNIKYYKFNSSKMESVNAICDDFISVELKSTSINLENYILKNFPFSTVRFSKYCRGISKAFKNIID